MESGTIDITKRIGVNWRRVGITLLNDTSGEVVSAIHQQCFGNVDDINLEVMKRWINGEGVGDRSWQRLLHVLRCHDCIALAEEIERCLPLQQPGSHMPGKSNLTSAVCDPLCINHPFDFFWHR